MREPAEYADEIERDATLPAGSGERFSGYGVMGLTFRFGHILGLRRFPASSIGPGYRSVWHRAPRGRWTFYQDQPAELACTRYFGAAVEEVREGPIEIAWTGPRRRSSSRRGTKDHHGYVLTGSEVRDAGRWELDRDPYLLETSAPGIFACGDVRFGPVKRVAAAVGEGSMAIAFVHQYLKDADSPANR